MKQDEPDEQVIEAMMAAWLHIPDFQTYSDDELIRNIKDCLKLPLNTQHRADAMAAMIELFRRDNEAVKKLKDYGILWALDPD